MITGYTIRVFDRIEQYSVSQGPKGLVTRENKLIKPPKPATASGTLYEDLSGIYGDDATKRVELLKDSAGTATDADIFAACPGLKPWLIDRVKSLRAQALEKITKNSGVFAVYSENYAAALAVQAGTGDTTIMKDGQTATVYLTGFSARLGMTAAQFAAYIISENRRVNPTAYTVEDEYLRLAYSVIPGSTDVTALLALPGQYQIFCGL